MSGQQDKRGMKASPKGEPSPEHAGHSPGQGVRYITDDLITKVSGHDHLPSLTSLNLTLSKEVGKKIRYIENLEKLKKLTVLSLGYNSIEKIEKLDRLTLLKDLNLSFNNISKIEGLETLKNLQTLNLTGNKIEHIPALIGKNLKALRVFRIAKNQLQSLHEFSKLRPIRDLSTLTIAENPVCHLTHCRLFMVYHLTTLETLDSQIITQDERKAAVDRFSQVELERLEDELESKEAEFSRLKDDHDRSLHEITERQNKEREALKAKKQQQESIKELNRELGTKNDLLKRKSAELMVAAQKHYELEQELAFYKIDHKFGALSEPPKAFNEDETEGINSVDMFGESPYIGKGRFQGLQRAMLTSVNQEIEEATNMGPLSFDSKTQAQKHSEIDQELVKKRKDIEQAQDRLEILLSELASTEIQISQANKELRKMSASMPGNQLTEDDKQEIRNRLAKKINQVHNLRDEVGKIEHDLTQTEDEIQDQEMYLGRLKGKMRRLGSKDPLYGVMKKEMNERENDLNLSQRQYQDLHDQLQDMLLTIAQETEEVKKLEAELREGLAFHNDEMKAELEGIVDGLQMYLSDVQHKTDDQRKNFDALTRDKAELSQCLRDLEADNRKVETQAGEATLLRERLALLEDSLLDQREENESLQQLLDESRLRQDEDADVSIQLKDAQDDIDTLQRKLAQAEDRAEVEQEALRKKLDIENKRLKTMKDKAKSVDLKDDEIHNLHDELTELQQSNVHLQDQLYNMNQKLMEEKKKSIDPNDLRRRLDNVTRAIRSGTALESPREEGDEVDEALNQMQKKVVNQLNKSTHEAEKAQMERDRAKDETKQLKDQVVQVRMKEREVAEHAIQAMVQQEQSAAEKLKEDLDRTRRELDKAKKFALEKELEASRLRDLEQELHALKEEKKFLPPHLLEASPQATTRSQTTSSSSGETGTSSSSSTDSTIPSSQWPAKKKELYESMTQDEQDLFNELQEEIDELRRLLMNRDHKEAAEKANQAESIARELRDLMESRRSTASSTSSNSEATTVKRRKVDAKVGASKKSGLPTLSDVEDELSRLKRQLQRQVKSSRPPDVPPIRLTRKEDEIAQMHNVLEAQNGEIQRLNERLEHLTSQEKPTENPPHDLHDGRPVPKFYPEQAPQQPIPYFQQPTAYPPQHAPSDPVPQQQTQAVSYALPQQHSYPPNVSCTEPPMAATQPVMGTPIMTPVNHAVSMVTTPGGAGVQPMMMSTPVHRDNRLRGILKSREGNSMNVSNIENEEELICTVPEHHDLEDYVTSLQNKVKKLKAKLKISDMDSLLDYSGRRVGFDDDSIDGQTFRQLQAELEERRTDMNGLDLAVERQQRMFEKRREKERSLLMQKRANLRELENLRAINKGERRRAFLMDEGNYDVDDDDYEYEYVPRAYSSRSSYLQEEIICLEKTLAKRRAELRESDRLLRECDEDLVAVRKEAKKTIEKYEAAKIGVSHSMKDAEGIERRARDAGKKLVQMEEEAEMLRDEADNYKEARERDQQMLQDIQNVITAKDAEFQKTQQQIIQAQNQFGELQNELLSTASSQQDRIDLIQDSGQALDDRRKELEDVRSKIKMERISLERVSRERAMREEDVGHKRRLESLDSQEEARRKEIHETDGRIVEVKSLKTHLEAEIKQQEDKLKKVRDEIDHEEEVMQNLAALTNKQKSDLREIEENLGQKEKAVDKLSKDIKLKQNDFHELQNRLLEDGHTLDTIQTEVRRRSTELDHLRKREENEQDELDHMQQQSNNMAAILSDMNKEKTSVEKEKVEAEESIADLKQTQKEVESSVKGQQQKLQRIDQQLRLVENAVHTAEGRKTELGQHAHAQEHYLSELHGNIGRAEASYKALEEELSKSQLDLSQTLSVLTEKQDLVSEIEFQISDLKRDVELRAVAQRNMLSLEERIEHLGREIGSRDREKAELAAALEKSGMELNDLKTHFSRDIQSKTSQVKELHDQLTALDHSLVEQEQELQYYRGKSANEIADLESVAQAHYSRANRLSDELDFLRAEHAELKAQINAERDHVEKGRLLEHTLHSFKQDLKEELTGSIMDIEKSRAEAVMEAEQLSSQKMSIEEQLDKLKLNLSMIRTGSTNPLNVYVQSDASRNSFAEQQAFLKQQLQQKMSRHVESMRSQRELSQNSIQHLQDKLKTLEKTLSSSENNLYRKKFSSQMPPNKDPDASAGVQEIPETTSVREDRGTGDAEAFVDLAKCDSPPALRPPSPVSRSPKRAYSPHRHSAQRNQRLQSPNRSETS